MKFNALLYFKCFLLFPVVRAAIYPATVISFHVMRNFKPFIYVALSTATENDVITVTKIATFTNHMPYVFDVSFDFSKKVYT